MLDEAGNTHRLGDSVSGVDDKQEDHNPGQRLRRRWRFERSRNGAEKGLHRDCHRDQEQVENAAKRKCWSYYVKQLTRIERPSVVSRL